MIVPRIIFRGLSRRITDRINSNSDPYGRIILTRMRFEKDDSQGCFEMLRGFQVQLQVVNGTTKILRPLTFSTYIPLLTAQLMSCYWKHDVERPFQLSIHEELEA